MTRKQEKAQSQQKHKSKSLTTGDLPNTCFQYSFRYLCCVFSICVSDTCTVFLFFVFPVVAVFSGCFRSVLCFSFSIMLFSPRNSSEQEIFEQHICVGIVVILFPLLQTLLTQSVSPIHHNHNFENAS